MPLNTFHHLLRVDVRSAKGLRDADIGGKSDAYAKIKFHDKEAVPHESRTHTLKDNLNPIWDTSFFFLVADECKSFKIDIRDEDVGGDDSLGFCNIVRKDRPERYTYAGEDYYLDKGKGGTVNVFTQEIDLSAGLKSIVSRKKSAVDAFLASKARAACDILEVCIHSCNGLKSSMLDKSDPYVKIQFDHEPEGDMVAPKDLKTKTIDNNTDPVFESYFHFMIPDTCKSMRLTVWDEDTGGDDNLGHTNVVIKGHMEFEDHKKYALNTKGTITVSYVRIPLPPLFA
jgi:Ca2+-dependent lipid-binding protein